MKIKCETILDIYKHKNTTILCQIKVQPRKYNKQQSRGWKNTCRFVTKDQWNSFDKELKNILKALRDKRDKWNDEIIRSFSIKPNIEVKVQKSKLSSTNFYNFMEADDEGVEDSGGEEYSIDNIKKHKQIVHVLEFVLDFKPRPTSIPSVEETQEYNPQTQPSPDDIFSSSPSVEPYTPSKKKYRANSLDVILTPAVDSLEDVYLPKPISTTISTNIDFPIPAYKPTRIKEKRSSQDSQTSNPSSNKNEAIADLSEELLPPEIFRTKGSKVLRKKAKRVIEYIPKSQEIITAPVYFPTPIEEKTAIKKDSQEENKSSKNNNKDKKYIIETIKEEPISEGTNQNKLKNILERPESSLSSDDDIDKSRIINTNNVNEFDINMRIKKSQEAGPENVSFLNISPLTATESLAAELSPFNKNTKKHKKFSDHGTTQIKRCVRSPIKQNRLTKEHSSKSKNEKKFKSQKSSPTSNKELFGTDDDDDDGDKNV